MARTNVEESGFTRALELAHEMEWSASEALGALTWLWHESQAKVRLGGTGREILRWSKLKSDGGYLMALVDLELIRPLVDQADPLENEYEIAGNVDEVNRLVALKEKSKKGGDSTRRKWDGEVQRMQDQAKSEPSARPVGLAKGTVDGLVLVGQTPGQMLGTVQCSTVQCSSIEEKNTETNAVAVASAETGIVPKRSKFNQGTRDKMVAFIRMYAEVWKAKYKSSPEGLKDKALIGKVGHWIEGVSEQRALDLVQVYLQVDYRPINESLHDLWQFFRHLNRIGLAMDTGQDIAGINWGEVFGKAS